MTITFSFLKTSMLVDKTPSPCFVNASFPTRGNTYSDSMRPIFCKPKVGMRRSMANCPTFPRVKRGFIFRYMKHFEMFCAFAIHKLTKTRVVFLKEVDWEPTNISFECFFIDLVSFVSRSWLLLLLLILVLNDVNFARKFEFSSFSCIIIKTSCKWVKNRNVDQN